MMKAKTAAMMFRVLGIGISAGLVAMDANAVEITDSIGDAVGIDVYKVQCTAATSKRISANVADAGPVNPRFQATVFVGGNRAVRRTQGTYPFFGEEATVFRAGSGTGPFTGHVLITDVNDQGNVVYRTNINCRNKTGAPLPTVVTPTQDR